MHVPTLFVARPTDVRVGTSASFPLLWQIEHESAAARRALQCHRGNLQPEAPRSSWWNMVETPSSEITST